MSEARASRVLLVDDDSSLRGILTIHLAMAGYEALQAEDGLHALGILRNTLPNVIISDLKNQRMSGLEFIGVMRRRFPTIPVIVFSGSIPIEFPTGSEPDRMIEKGPGTFPELMRAVDELARTTPDDVPPPASDQRTGPDRARLRRLCYSDLHGLPSHVHGAESTPYGGDGRGRRLLPLQGSRPIRN